MKPKPKLQPDHISIGDSDSEQSEQDDVVMKKNSPAKTTIKKKSKNEGIQQAKSRSKKKANTGKIKKNRTPRSFVT